MEVEDPIYGKFNIENPIFEELMSSDALQRLKGVSQFGIPDRYYHIEGYSRFEHSLGVMMLLRLLGASQEEQVAGLTHDVSHTAFSHVVDWVLGGKESEEFQDEKHREYFINSDLAEIIRKYDYDPSTMSNHQSFSLLEQDLPRLCADRIDYCLREVAPKTAKRLVRKLVVVDNRIVFEDKKPAKIFAEVFLEKQMSHWGGFEAVARYSLFADALKMALSEGILEFSDFWQEEKQIINKLEASNHKRMNKILSLLRENSLSYLPKSEKVEYKKFRYVDPEFISDDGLAVLSDSDEKFRILLQNARQKNQEGIKLPKI